MEAQQAAQVQTSIEALSRRGLSAIDLYRRTVSVLGRAVPFDAWCGLTLDPVTLLPTGGYHEEGLPADRMPRLMEIEYSQDDVNQFPALARSRSGSASLQTSTRGVAERSTRFREVLQPSGIEHELRVALRDGSRTWGGLVLMRSADAGSFEPAEVALTASVGRVLGIGVRRALLLAAVEEGPAPEGPGLVILSGPGAIAVENITSAARRWLRNIDDGTHGPEHLPHVVFAVARRAGVDSTAMARARVRTRGGRWLDLHATLLERLPEERIAVVVEPSRPHEVLALAMDAYGLTAREKQVMQLALCGHTNEEIAGLLCISPWTAQDHVRNTFEKMGVHSRAELTSRLFFDHYLSPMSASKSIGLDGWFSP